MQESYNRTSRIAKNTVYMYGRMIITLAISLYTVRLVFNVLGEDDYGIYNIVGGLVVFFVFLNNGLSTATKRFITADIADNNIEKGRHTFNICLYSHFIVGFIVLLLAETIGSWIVLNLLNIPPERQSAAFVIFQISIISALVSIIQSPYSATIVAYEKMSIYAYLTIFDVASKLFLIYVLQISQGDKLIVYALLMLGSNILCLLINFIYCIKKFSICRFMKCKDLNKLKEVFMFMSWSLLGQAAVVGTNQGVNVLLNIFRGISVNAAMGISNQLTQVVSQFASNFQIAFNPQIIKSYNLRDYDYLNKLVSWSSKISSYLIILIVVPLLFVMDDVLTLWLGDYPEFTKEFCIFTLLCIYLDSISAPLYMVVYSQTNIRKYQLIISSVYSLTFFGGWLVLLMGVLPYMVMVVRLCVFMVLLIIRTIYVKKVFSVFNIKDWYSEIIVKGLFVAVILYLIIWALLSIMTLPSHFLKIIIVFFFSFIFLIPLCFCFGINKNERGMVLQFIKNKIKHE